MGAESRRKNQHLPENRNLQMRMVGSSSCDNVYLFNLCEFRAELLRRYPVGLIDDAEIEELLKSWLNDRALETEEKKIK
ncbi:hypothetical protein ACIOYV_11710 [Pseudomonas sp. NPDC087342]|uniref:hypothetical protein n=1 Tax=Pseudomonas sp. NPDC087342 TaxID=3364437 RepID=UPI0038290F82